MASNVAGRASDRDEERTVQFWMKRHKVWRKAASLVYDEYAGTYKFQPRINPIKAQWEFGAKPLKISSPPPVESIVDFRLLEEVLKE